MYDKCKSNVKEVDMGKALVAIIMGSQSDWDVMRHAAETLDELNIPFQVEIISAHRTPDRMFEFSKEAEAAGFRVIIAGAGGAAHLPGMTATQTVLPVIGVPVPSAHLNGMDSLLSIVQMPGGVPVATMAIGKAGAVNAGLYAAAILGGQDPEIRGRLKAYRQALRERVEQNAHELSQKMRGDHLS